MSRLLLLLFFTNLFIFKDTAREAGCLVTGGQTVVNPWCTIGGVASSVCTMDKVCKPRVLCLGRGRMRSILEPKPKLRFTRSILKIRRSNFVS